MVRRARGPGTRAGLTSETIVKAALALADERGPERFSMRALADRLGVDAMATYHWFASRDHLFDAMAELALEERHAGELNPDQPWDALLREVAVAFWRTLLAHPGIVSHVSARIPATPTMIRLADLALGALRRAGFSDDAAVECYQSMANFIHATALTAIGRAGLTPEQITRARARAGELVARLDPADYPNAVALVPRALQLPIERRFQIGLDLMLDGLRARVPKRSRRG